MQLVQECRFPKHRIFGDPVLRTGRIAAHIGVHLRIVDVHHPVRDQRGRVDNATTRVTLDTSQQFRVVYGVTGDRADLGTVEFVHDLLLGETGDHLTIVLPQLQYAEFHATDRQSIDERTVHKVG